MKKKSDKTKAESADINTVTDGQNHMLTLKVMEDQSNTLNQKISLSKDASLQIAIDNQEVFSWQSDSNADAILNDADNTKNNHEKGNSAIEGFTKDIQFQTAEKLKKPEDYYHITTGSNELDELLDNGIKTQLITEILGGFRTGKSLIVHQLAINAQLTPDKGGLDGDVVFIDTDNTFRPKRIEEMLHELNEVKGLELELENVLKRIHVAKTINSNEQIKVIEKIDNLINKDNINVKLIIVDSLLAHFLAEYNNRKSFVAGHKKLKEHLDMLQKLAIENDVAVVVTNHIQSKSNKVFKTSPHVFGAHIIKHMATYRILLKNALNDNKKACLLPNPYDDEKEVVFKVNKNKIIV